MVPRTVRIPEAAVGESTRESGRIECRINDVFIDVGEDAVAEGSIAPSNRSRQVKENTIDER